MGVCVLLLSNLFARKIYFMSSVFLGLTAASIPFIISAEKTALRGKWKNLPFAVCGAALVAALALLRSGSGVLGSLDFLQLRPLHFVYIFLSGMLRVKDGKPIAKLSNPLLGDLYGVAPGEMASADQLAMERIPQPYRARVTEKLGELLAAGTSIHIDFPYHRDDSEERRWYRMDSRSVASGTELLYFSCLSDITDEINAEMEREKVRKM